MGRRFWKRISTVRIHRDGDVGQVVIAEREDGVFQPSNNFTCT